MRSVLLIDDDESNRDVLSALLEDYGYEVDVAASFRRAREKIGADSAAYGIVLLDQHLGDGLGSDLIPSIRSRLPGVKVILISGSIERGDARAALADAVATKGAAITDVLNLIERVSK